jgi:hypothetical protein
MASTVILLRKRVARQKLFLIARRLCDVRSIPQARFRAKIAEASILTNGDLRIGFAVL